MNKLEQLEDDVLRALAAWHGVDHGELGLHWERLASAFARLVEFTGLTATKDRHPDSVVVRASALLEAVGDVAAAASDLVE